MNVVVVRDQRRPHLGGTLNVRQLLNPLFYDGAWLKPRSKHPDRKRQRKARLKALALHQARSLKALEVPLRLVDRTVYLELLHWVYYQGPQYLGRELRVEVRRVEC